MDWHHLLLSLQGRISRKPYWFGVAAVLIASLMLHFSALGFSIYRWEDVATGGSNVQWTNLAIAVLLLYPSLAVLAKRLHDRNKTAWWFVLIYGTTIVTPLFELAGIAGTVEQPSTIAFAWSFVVFVIGVWFFIELGFLKGTQGPNQFGPDPLGATMADAEFEV